MTFTDLPDEVKNEFCDLANHLSPENVSCDGELSRGESMRRYQSLISRWHALEDSNDIEVTEDEVWNWWITSKK